MKTKGIKRRGKNKTRKNMKGGFIETRTLTFPGLGSFGTQTGRKIYDYKTNQWKDQTCYTIFGYQFCI